MPRKNNVLIKHLNDVLVDADFENSYGETDWGGISFVGETLLEFLEELDHLSLYSSCKEINKALINSNIQPIKF